MPNEDSPVEKMEIPNEVNQQRVNEQTDDVEMITVQSPEVLAEDLKSAGNAEYAKKNYETAVKFYSEAIQLNPIASYYGNRAAAYVMLSQYARALEDARKSTQLDPTFIKGYLREAKCQLALGEVAPALHLYEKVLEKESGNATALAEHKQAKHVQDVLAKAEACFKREDFRTVIYNIDRCIEVCTNCLKFKTLKAECLALLKRYEEAQNLASDILRQDGLCADAVYIRGLCLYQTDVCDKAFQHFQQVLRIAPDHAKARDVYRKAKNLIAKKEEGNDAYKKGRYSDAQILYKEALSIDPSNSCTNSKLYFNMANVFCKMGKMEDAIACCNSAIKLDSKYLKAYHRRARCYMEMEKYEEAVKEYESLLRLEKTRETKALLEKAKLELKKSKRKDYYKVLGVGKTASEDEIKKAYRKHALLHHPDRHSGASDEVKKAEEKKFKEVGEAYAVLSDANKKSLYDSGHDLDDINSGGAGGFDPNFDPNIIFQSFFGGGHRQQQGFSSGGFPGFPGGFAFHFG